MDDMDFRRLVGALATKQLFVCGTYDEYADNQYGYVETTAAKLQYVVSSPANGQIMSVDYKSDAVAVIEGFENIIEGIQMETVNITTTRKHWAEPEGSAVVVFGLGLTGLHNNLDTWGDNELVYENDAIMNIRLSNDSNGLVLHFKVVWQVDKVQRKEAIEEVLVDTVMGDMGLIQAIVEGRLKLKSFAYNVEDVEINCHFDAKTESRSECTPDIIKQVREARKGLE